MAGPDVNDLRPIQILISCVSHSAKASANYFVQCFALVLSPAFALSVLIDRLSSGLSTAARLVVTVLPLWVANAYFAAAFVWFVQRVCGTGKAARLSDLFRRRGLRIFCASVLLALTALPFIFLSQNSPYGAGRSTAVWGVVATSFMLSYHAIVRYGIGPIKSLFAAAKLSGRKAGRLASLSLVLFLVMVLLLSVTESLWGDMSLFTRVRIVAFPLIMIYSTGSLLVFLAAVR